MIPRLPTAAGLLLAVTAAMHGQDARVENARAQLSAAPTPAPAAVEAAANMGLGQEETAADDAFGVQQILKRQEKVRPFRVYADLAGSLTDNVALSRVDHRHDALMVATFGFDASWALNRHLTVTGYAREALFRYDRERTLDFDSLDLGTSVLARVPQLPGVDFFVRYNFNQLYGEQSDETFFKNHTVAVGGQKLWPVNRALYFYTGASALWGFADPKEAGRDEYSLFAGGHLQISRSVGADALYRYGWWPYRGGGRRDHNQAVSLQLRWRWTAWAELYAAGYYSWNRSNFEVFDYEVGNIGGGLTLQVQF